MRVRISIEAGEGEDHTAYSWSYQTDHNMDVQEHLIPLVNRCHHLVGTTFPPRGDKSQTENPCATE